MFRLFRRFFPRPSDDPIPRQVAAILESWRAATGDAIAEFRRETDATDLNRQLVALCAPDLPVERWPADAPEGRESDAANTSSRYLSHLLYAHGRDPDNAEARQLRPFDIELRFTDGLQAVVRVDGEMRPDVLQADIADLTRRAQIFATVARGRGEEALVRWHSAARRASEAMTAAGAEAKDKLDALEADAQAASVGRVVSPSLEAARVEIAGPTGLPTDADLLERVRKVVADAFAGGLLGAEQLYEGTYLVAYRDHERQADWEKVRADLLSFKRIRYRDIPLSVRENELWTEMARGPVRILIDKAGRQWVREDLSADQIKMAAPGVAGPGALS